MNKSLSTIKKFQFFDLDKSGKADQKLSSVGYKLTNIIPIEMRVYNKYYYICGQLRLDNNKHNRFRLIKIHPDGTTIMDEYIPFTDTINNFNILDVDGKTYLVILGTDLKNPETDKFEGKVEVKPNNQLGKDHSSPKVLPTPNSIPSVKIFDFTNYAEKTNVEINQWQEAVIDKDDEEKMNQRITFLEKMTSPLITIPLMKKKTTTLNIIKVPEP